MSIDIWNMYKAMSDKELQTQVKSLVNDPNYEANEYTDMAKSIILKEQITSSQRNALIIHLVRNHEKYE